MTTITEIINFLEVRGYNNIKLEVKGDLNICFFEYFFIFNNKQDYYITLMIDKPKTERFLLVEDLNTILDSWNISRELVEEVMD
jgi:hypothetical protein